MKNRKIIALLLASVMCISTLGISACSKNEEEETEVVQEETEDEAKVEESTQAEISETTIAETESIEETSVVTPVDVSDVVIGDSANADNEADATAYALFMDYVRNNTFDSNAKFAFDMYRYSQDDPVDSRWGLVVVTNDVLTNYAVINGQVEETTMGYDWYSDNLMSREDLLQLPIMITGINGEISSSSTLEDGTYYGSMLCFNTDGTQALITLGHAIVIDSSTYESLSSATSFTDVYGETYTIDTESDEYQDIVVDASGTEYWGYFVDNHDGTYRLEGDSDYTYYHNRSVCFIDITNDCAITDNFAWLIGLSDPTVGVNPNEPLTFTNTHYYDSIINYEYGNVYNGWAQGSQAILEPVVVENGQIVSMVLGWR